MGEDLRKVRVRLGLSVESMDELFRGYDMSYVPHVPDWGNDVGLEVIE